MKKSSKSKQKIVQKQKGSANSFFIVAIIAVAIVIGVYLLKENLSALTSQMAQPASAPASISSDKDLLNSYQDLDNTNVDNSIDPQLNQTNADAQNL